MWTKPEKKNQLFRQIAWINNTGEPNIFMRKDRYSKWLSIEMKKTLILHHFFLFFKEFDLFVWGPGDTKVTKA